MTALATRFADNLKAKAIVGRAENQSDAKIKNGCLSLDGLQEAELLRIKDAQKQFRDKVFNGEF